jgi:aryl-alcohol dehydrogenase-like predicted oxidoreductase
VEFRPLGSSGIQVSSVGIGCNSFGVWIGADQAQEVVDAALDAGVNFFDTAEVYGNGASEELLGNAIRARRDEAAIATKFGQIPGYIPDGVPRGDRSHVRASLEGSLERLGLDHVDLLYYHMPDGMTPLEETLSVMQELVAEGKTRAIGVSNFFASELQYVDEAAHASGTPGFCAIQNQYSLLARDAERDVLPLAHELGIAFVPYFPLASGLLTGKYRRGEAAPEGSRLRKLRADEGGPGAHLLGEDRFDQVERLAHFAEEQGRTLHELAMAALTSRPGVTSVIAGATSREQVHANIAASTWRLDAETLDGIPRVEGLGWDALDRPNRNPALV